MTRNEIVDVLRNLIAERTQHVVPAQDIGQDEPLVNGPRFSLDSLDKLHLLIGIENEIDVSFSEVAPTDESFGSLNALASLVLAAQRQGGEQGAA